MTILYTFPFAALALSGLATIHPNAALWAAFAAAALYCYRADRRIN